MCVCVCGRVYGDIQQSIKAYQDGLAIEPANETLQAGLQEVEAVKARGGAGAANPMGALGGIFSSPDVWAKIGMNPQTRGYLQQPDFVAMLQAVQANPSSLGQYMQVSTTVGLVAHDPRLSVVVLLCVCVCVRRSGVRGTRVGCSPSHTCADWALLLPMPNTPSTPAYCAVSPRGNETGEWFRFVGRVRACQVSHPWKCFLQPKSNVVSV